MEQSRPSELSYSPSGKNGSHLHTNSSKKPGFIRKRQEEVSDSRSRSKSPGMIFNKNSMHTSSIAGK